MKQALLVILFAAVVWYAETTPNADCSPTMLCSNSNEMCVQMGLQGTRKCQTCDCKGVPDQCDFHQNGNSYTCDCTQPPYGWQGQHCKEDIDECDEETDDCPDFSECVNTDGSYGCNCLIGYEESEDDNGETICVDFNECDTNSDLCGDLVCVNSQPGYCCQGPCVPGT